MADNKQNAANWEDKMRTLRTLWRWIYRLRGIVLAIPVVVAAVFLAIYNMANLPDIIALSVQANGEYAQAITKGVAVMGPFALTLVCVFLMFCSKRVLYPWLISIFSLVLPLVFLFTSSFL